MASLAFFRPIRRWIGPIVLEVLLLAMPGSALQTPRSTPPTTPAAPAEDQVATIKDMAEAKAEDFEIAQRLIALARDGRPEAASALYELVDAFNGQLRIAAISALGASLAPNRTELLGLLVLKSKQRPDRIEATRMLVRSPAGTAWLTDRYKKIKDDEVRALVIESLAAAGIADENFILKALREKNPLVRATALEAAAALGIDRAAKTALKGIEDGNQRVCRSAALAAARFGGVKAFKALCQAVEDTKNPDLRIAFRTALQQADDPEEVEILAEAMLDARADADLVLFARALERAGPHQAMIAGQAFATLLERKEADIRRLALRGIEATHHEAALPQVVALLGDQDFGVRSDALRALSTLPALPADVAAQVVQLAADQDPKLRLSATLALPMLPADLALAALGERLQDPLWSIRDAAVAGLGQLRSVGALRLLAEHMQRATGLVREETYDLLTTMTGEDFGPTPRAWSKWAADLAADYQLPAPEQAASHLSALRARRATTDSTYGSTTYHGMAVRPSNVVFILDISGSMGFTYTPDARSFFAYFSAELEHTIENLGGDHRFGLITFSGSANAWRQDLVEPTEANKAAAISYLTSIRPWGATNLYHALLLAFEFPEVQQIYLMTDGDPTAGAIQDKAALTDWITEINRDRRVRIHTVIAGDVDGDFIAELAALNGGTSVDLRNQTTQ